MWVGKVLTLGATLFGFRFASVELAPSVPLRIGHDLAGRVVGATDAGGLAFRMAGPDLLAVVNPRGPEGAAAAELIRTGLMRDLSAELAVRQLEGDDVHVTVIGLAIVHRGAVEGTALRWLGEGAS